MTVRVTYDDMRKEAMKVVASLDRDGLGRFGTTADKLTAVIGWFLTDSKAQQLFVGRPLITTRFYTDFHILCTGTEDERSQQWSDVVAEMVFWGTINPEVPVPQYKGIDTRVDNLGSAYWHRGLHDYFAVGIWDVRAAYTFQINGIDPELALVVND